MCCCSVAKACLTLWPHGLQHTRLPCLSPSPRVCSGACPLSWWCHPAVTSSVVPFSSCPQSLPASGSFPVSQLFASGGQRIGASVLAPILSVNIQGWFPLGSTDLISLQSKGLSTVFSSTAVWRHQFFYAQPSLWSNPHVHTYLLGKTITLTVRTFVSKMMSLLFNTTSRFALAFLPRRIYLLLYMYIYTCINSIPVY